MRHIGEVAKCKRPTLMAVVLSTRFTPEVTITVDPQTSGQPSIFPFWADEQTIVVGAYQHYIMEGVENRDLYYCENLQDMQSLYTQGKNIGGYVTWYKVDYPLLLLATASGLFLAKDSSEALTATEQRLLDILFEPEQAFDVTKKESFSSSATDGQAAIRIDISVCYARKGAWLAVIVDTEATPLLRKVFLAPVALSEFSYGADIAKVVSTTFSEAIIRMVREIDQEERAQGYPPLVQE